MLKSLLLIAVLLSGACKKTPGLPDDTTAPGADSSALAAVDSSIINYLALGDSYTIGSGINPSGSLPLQLADSLHSRGFKLAKPTIIAQLGWTSTDLLRELRRRNLQPKFNLVTLLIGVNNQYQGRSAAGYSKEVTDLILLAIKLTGDKKDAVLVLSIPDWGVTPFLREVATVTSFPKRLIALMRLQIKPRSGRV